MTIRIDRQGAVAQLVLARPEKLNALSPEMMEQLGEATLALQRDTSVRAVVLRGEGKAFCAGGDVDTMGSFNGGGKPQQPNVGLSFRDAVALPSSPACGWLHEECSRGAQ